MPLSTADIAWGAAPVGTNGWPVTTRSAADAELRGSTTTAWAASIHLKRRAPSSSTPENPCRNRCWPAVRSTTTAGSGDAMVRTAIATRPTAHASVIGQAASTLRHRMAPAVSTMVSAMAADTRSKTTSKWTWYTGQTVVIEKAKSARPIYGSALAPRAHGSPCDQVDEGEGTAWESSTNRSRRCDNNQPVNPTVRTAPRSLDGQTISLMTCT